MSINQLKSDRRHLSPGEPGSHDLNAKEWTQIATQLTWPRTEVAPGGALNLDLQYDPDIQAHNKQSPSRQKSHGFVLHVYIHHARDFCYT